MGLTSKRDQRIKRPRGRARVSGRLSTVRCRRGSEPHQCNVGGEQPVRASRKALDDPARSAARLGHFQGIAVPGTGLVPGTQQSRSERSEMRPRRYTSRIQDFPNTHTEVYMDQGIGDKVVDKSDIVWPGIRLICTGVGGVKLGERMLEFGQSVFVPKGTLEVLVLPRPILDQSPESG